LARLAAVGWTANSDDSLPYFPSIGWRHVRGLPQPNPIQRRPTLLSRCTITQRDSPCICWALTRMRQDCDFCVPNHTDAFMPLLHQLNHFDTGSETVSKLLKSSREWRQQANLSTASLRCLMVQLISRVRPKIPLARSNLPERENSHERSTDGHEFSPVIAM
jgi:hypothetical protein